MSKAPMKINPIATCGQIERRFGLFGANPARLLIEGS
jgi:hypothetical protein